MNRLGIMLGRLSPPSGGRLQAFPWATWTEEFACARDCGFDELEWLATAERIDENPIWHDDGVEAIRALMADTGVRVRSLNADCLVTRPFVRVSDSARAGSVAVLEHLIGQSARAGIDTVVVPVLESGEIRTRADAAVLRDSLRGPLALARTQGIRLAIECDLAAVAYRELLETMPAAGACYDIGNATARAGDVGADLRVLGAALCHVHVKDRRVAGPSLPLGEGDADFDAAAAGLSAAGYSGALILETPAGDDPPRQARRHLAFVRDRLSAGLGGRVAR